MAQWCKALEKAQIHTHLHTLNTNHPSGSEIRLKTLQPCNIQNWYSLLQAVLHTGHEFSVTVPCEADIHAPVGQSPGGDPMGRPAPLEVLEGQECRMLLALNNIGGLPIAGITLAVVSQKGRLGVRQVSLRHI